MTTGKNSPLQHHSRAVGRDATKVLHGLTDEASGLRVSIAPFAGGEIASIQTRKGDGWLELLDRAEDFTPCDRWRGRAPWLWPAVGRHYTVSKLQNALRTGSAPSDFEWDHQGAPRPMPIHGFAMGREWKVAKPPVGHPVTGFACSLADDEQSRRMYPFGFLLTLSFWLNDGALTSRLRVDAAKDNSGPMPFCLGNHLTLRSPLTGAGRFEDVRVHAPVRRVYEVTRLGLVGDPAELSLREGVALSNPRLHNLVVGHFSPEQATVRVVDPSGVEIEIGQQEIMIGDRAKAPPDGFYFVFYGSPRHRFFCPEPWLGLPNALNTLRPVVQLAPGQTFEWEVTLRIRS